MATLLSAETLNSPARRPEATEESEPGASMPPDWSTSTAFGANAPQTPRMTSQTPRTYHRNRYMKEPSRAKGSVIV